MSCPCYSCIALVYRCLAAGGYRSLSGGHNPTEKNVLRGLHLGPMAMCLFDESIFPASKTGIPVALAVCWPEAKRQEHFCL